MNRQDLEAIQVIRNLTRIQIRLGEHDSILAYKGDDTCIMVMVQVHDVQETRYEIRFKRQGTKTYLITRGEHRWQLQVMDPVWDTAFVPYVYEKLSRYETAAERAGRLEWEDMCHRPGTRKTPMDNTDRRAQYDEVGR